MNYSEKLQDPRWKEFRNGYICRKTREDGVKCDDCGEDTDTSRSLHVHHRVYHEGADPWAYKDSELLLICKGCHERIHRTEQRLRVFIRALRPHECYEMNDLMDELEIAKLSGRSKIAFARAKNAVRQLNYASLKHHENTHG